MPGVSSYTIPSGKRRQCVVYPCYFSTPGVVRRFNENILRSAGVSYYAANFRENGAISFPFCKSGIFLMKNK